LPWENYNQSGDGLQTKRSTKRFTNAACDKMGLRFKNTILISQPKCGPKNLLSEGRIES
jgi:hypothetical protein